MSDRSDFLSRPEHLQLSCDAGVKTSCLAQRSCQAIARSGAIRSCLNGRTGKISSATATNVSIFFVPGRDAVVTAVLMRAACQHGATPRKGLRGKDG